MDAEAINDLLRNNFGATKGVNAPASHTLHLFAGSTELTTGYTPPTITNDAAAWPDPSNGYLVGAAVTITYTATLAAPATRWQLKGADGNWSVGGFLPRGPWNGGAGVSDSFRPTITFALGAA